MDSKNYFKIFRARIMNYNEELVYSRLSNFININFNKERSTKIDYKPEQVKEDIAFAGNNSMLDMYCHKGKKLCVLAFLDGRSKKNVVKQFESNIKTLENINNEAIKNNKPTSFVWVNATCQV